MTHYTGHPYMELMPPEFMSVHIRIDNIPQGKDWKQIRYFLSKFILRNQILNIKVLPSMPTMTPPFIPITSCICVLQPSVDWNNLLLQLNGFQWEYYTLGAILLPPSSLTAPLHPRHGSVGSHMQPQHQVPQHSIRSHLHHMGVPAGGPIPGLIPGSIPDGRQRSYYSPQQSQPPRNQQSHSQQQQQQQQQQQPRKLKQLFNETSFRKQMSSRSMYQIKFTNFPPCLHWDEIIKFKTTGVAGQHVTRASDVPSLIVKTTEPEIYGKLKWTMLKDFIKLNCPELFENTSSFEFYVGVYESGELDVEIQIKEGKNEEVVVSEEGPEAGTANKEDVREGSADSSSDSPDVETSPKTVSSDVKDSGETKNDVIAVSETDSDKLKEVHLQEHQETEESEHKKSEEDSVQTDNSNGSIEKYMIKATIYGAVVGFVNYDKFLKCLHTFQGKEYGLSHKLVLEALESIEPN